jgi:hypothetical protein
VIPYAPMSVIPHSVPKIIIADEVIIHGIIGLS